MSSRFSSTFANFLKREDGPTAVEYAVMLGLLVVGCVAAILLPGTNTDAGGKGRTFTINLGGRTYGTRVAHVESWDTGGGADSNAEQGEESTVVVGWEARSTHDTYPARSAIRYNADAEASPKAGAGSRTGDALAPAKDQRGASNSSEDEENMSEDDARQAIVGLLEAYPKFFPVAKQTIQTAAIVREADHIEIDLFRCYLETRRFTYGPLPAGAGQARDQKTGVVYSGVFYQGESGAWTGKLTD